MSKGLYNKYLRSDGHWQDFNSWNHFRSKLTRGVMRRWLKKRAIRLMNKQCLNSE